MGKLSINLISTLMLLGILLTFALPIRANSFAQTQENVGSELSRSASLTPLDWAQRLIDDIAFKDNAYASKPTYLEWKGVEGATQSRNRTVCSSFITRLLKRSYGYSSADIESWMGTANPQAATYYDTITRQNRFQLIAQVNQIQPGDFLAIKYLENAQSPTDEGASDETTTDDTRCPKRSSVTGHIVLVRQAPVVHQSSPPLQLNLTQYALDVIDSSRSGHGCQDTRLLPKKSCSDKDAWGKGGAGQGTMRLYADQSGTIAGYSWSLRARSTYYSQTGYADQQGCQIPGHPLAVGRLLKN